MTMPPRYNAPDKRIEIGFACATLIHYPGVFAAASSAEWLVEAPSSCHYEVCSQASLANFGSVGMTGISAAADGVAGALNDPRWKVVRLRLVPGKVHLPSYPRATPFSRIVGKAPDLNAARMATSF